MHQSILLALLFSAISARAFPQQLIQVSHEPDSKGGYQFYCINRGYCPYVLDVELPGLGNGRADRSFPLEMEVRPGRNNIFKLSRIRPDSSISFRYVVGYHKGCIQPAPMLDFTYLLPIAPGKTTLAHISEGAGKQGTPDSTSNPWYMVRLKMQPGDTLYSARRGMVTEVEQGSDLNDQGLASLGEENYVEIVHADCTFGHYGVLRKNGAFVKPGQFVEAGVPIGIIGGDKYGRGSEARLSVHYNLPGQGPKTSGGEELVNWNDVRLMFWTRKLGKMNLKNGYDYTSEFPSAVLNQELKKLAKPKPGARKKSS
jgi:hypothetical protein